MVYVIFQNGQPLMPTENHAKVRVLLKTKKAGKSYQTLSVYHTAYV